MPTPVGDAVRSAASRVTTPLLRDDHLHLVNPLRASRELRSTVTRS